MKPLAQKEQSPPSLQTIYAKRLFEQAAQAQLLLEQDELDAAELAITHGEAIQARALSQFRGNVAHIPRADKVQGRIDALAFEANLTTDDDPYQAGLAAGRQLKQELGSISSDPYRDGLIAAQRAKAKMRL